MNLSKYTAERAAGVTREIKHQQRRTHVALVLGVSGQISEEARDRTQFQVALVPQEVH